MTVVERLRNRGVTPRAVLYARFSSDNQREESIEAQLRAMHEYCSRNSIVVIHEFCDRAKSATTDDRPEFLKMIAASREGDFDFAIVHKLDRFSRNRYDSAYYKRELKKNGVQLLSVLEQMDDSPESIILESVLEGMSEYYSKNLAREAYRELCQQEDGTDKDKIRTLRQNLKTVEQKINNIVNIIANTGSAALVTQLTQLEREKELLDVQIQEEERSAEESELDEDAILAAFRQAQKMFHNGTLPQMEQIINLYLDKVLVYPDYVEIHLNNVPTNLLNPSETKDEPALGGLHTFYIEKMCERNAPQNRTRKKEKYGYIILVKLHRKEQKKSKSRRKGQKETRAQDGLDSSKTGGAVRSISELEIVSVLFPEMLKVSTSLRPLSPSSYT